MELGKGRDGPTYRTLRAAAEVLNIELPINPVTETDSLIVETAELGEVSQSQMSLQACHAPDPVEWKDLWTTAHLDLIGQGPHRASGLSRNAEVFAAPSPDRLRPTGRSGHDEPAH